MFEGVFKALCLSSVVAFGSFSSHVLENKESSFYQDYTSYKRADRTRLPIGIFDSGTGGLTVMSAIVKLDEFNNVTGDRGGDGIPDFQTIIGRSFTYPTTNVYIYSGQYFKCRTELYTDIWKVGI